ncbi:MAG TPA: S-layer homology domain-containing protein, partial [Chloroflexia bacterium]
MMQSPTLAPAARRIPRPLLFALLAGLAFAMAGLVGTGSAALSPAPVPAALAAAPLGCPPGFVITASPNISNSLNTFYAVAARAAGDVWAVGNYDNGGILQTLTAHYDGAAWTAVPSPNQGSTNNTLQGVAALAPDDAWAVGGYGEAITQSQTLIEHWNGSAWSLATPPAVSGANGLLAVSAVAPNDVWAVGSAANIIGAPQTFIAHWNGSAWSHIASPNGTALGLNVLTSVSARAADDVWAAGFYTDLSGVSYTLIEHWNGTAWSVIDSPERGTGDNALRGIVALAANDVWAVGSAANAGGTPETLIEHWNGTAWSIVSSPNQGTSGNVLQAVSATGTGDVWAAGESGGSAGAQTLVLHWNGTAWSIVPSPNQGTGANTLYGIAAVAADDVWAAGTYADAAAVNRTLVLHYTTVCSTPTATATVAASPTATPPPPATATPGGPPSATATPGGPTATPVASATPCPIAFTDVPPSQPFYAYIRCLACRGIVSGYSDNTFRPGNDVTRGQLAKFVSNAAGYADAIPATQQTFSDVPPADPFWLFIERAALHGVISGYSDGTFHPTANVTRGQAAKFIANSAGYTDAIPATQQSFTDVLPVDTFWLFIERVKLHDVISGYTCGA